MSLELIGKSNITSRQDASMSALSTDGKYIFAVPVNSTEPIAGVLYDDLNQIATIATDSIFKYPLWGAASDDLSILSILEANELTSIRVRIYKKEDLLAPYRIIEINDQVISKFASQGKVILDNKYISLTYALKAGSESYESVLAVYDIESGVEVLRIPFAGYTNSGGYLFKFREKSYLALGWVGAANTVGGFTYKSPALLEIHELSSKKKIINRPMPTLITDMSTPKGCSHASSVPLAVSFLQVSIEGVPDLYDVPLFNNTNETSGIRIYSFDGGKLKLAGSRQQTNNILSLSFTPDGRYLAAALQTGFVNPVILYRIKNIEDSHSCRPQYKFRIKHVETTPSQAYSLNFGADGRLLLTSGSGNPKNGLAALGLYRVHR